MGSSFSARLLLSPDEQGLYLIRRHYAGDDLWEVWTDSFEVESGQLLKTISLGNTKWSGDYKLSPDGSLLYIRETKIAGNQIRGYQFTTVDLASGQVIKSLTGEGEKSPLGCRGRWWLSANARYLYCLQYDPDQLRITDMEKAEVVGLIPLPPHASESIDTTDSPHGPEFLQGDIFLQSPDSRYLYYIRPLKEPNVIKIDLTDQKIVASTNLPVTTGPGAPFSHRLARRIGSWFVSTAEAKMVFSVSAAISGDGQHLYFPSLQGEPAKQGDITLPAKTDGIWIVDTRTLAVEKHIRVERQLWGEMHLSSDGRRLYTYDCYEASVTGLDTATGEVTAFKSEEITGFPGPCARIMRVITIP